ncbi:MAG: hypothetical protein ACFE8U_03910 [Candidatus Hermodarchaeota archaeon]
MIEKKENSDKRKLIEFYTTMIKKWVEKIRYFAILLHPELLINEIISETSLEERKKGI